MMDLWEYICNNLDGLKHVLVMFLVQLIMVVVNISYKCAIHDGMSAAVLVVYRSIFGAIFMVPLAFFVERKKRPKLTWKTIFYGFLGGLLIGSLGQNLYLGGLALTSATFASAMMNLVPATTFLVAICLRIEKVRLSTSTGKAKVLGTIVGIGGAMVITFYKGPELAIWNIGVNLLEITTTHSPHAHGHTMSHNYSAVGVVLAVASCVTYSLWLIVNAKAAEEYPCPYTVSAMTTVWASFQSILFAVCTEKERSSWIMGWDVRLFTVVFSGIFGSGVMFTLVAWCVRMRGPLFVSVFNPLLLVMVAIAGSILLKETLHVGMLVGAILIVGALYTVLWGNDKELKKKSVSMPECEGVHVDMLLPPSAPQT